MLPVLLRPLLVALALLAAPAAWGVASEPVRDEAVAVQLVTTAKKVAPGDTLEVGVRFRMDPGWHIYWDNPGDTGRATILAWEWPEGTTVASLPREHPVRYGSDPFVDFVYEDEATYYEEVTVPADWPAGKPFPLAVEADWLMCEKVCIPGRASLQLAQPTGPETIPDPAETAALAAARQEWPAGPGNLRAELRRDGDRLQLSLEGLGGSGAEPAGELFFFPEPTVVSPSAPQSWQAGGGRLTGELVASEYAGELPATVRGVLLHPDGWEATDGRRALLVEAEVVEGAPLAAGSTGSPSGSSSSPNWAALFALAFAGGLILNLMPCVFPVLGLKVMGFVQQAGEEKRKVVAHGLTFTAGVVASFWGLAGLLLLLRASGAELGWGFQLQEPAFVFGMAAFLLLFALNLSGVFEIGMGLASAGGQAESRHAHGFSGSFLSGILATVVATPCSAPFLATALAGALTLPALPSLALFTVIALGLATPYLLLSAFPALLRKLPRPGAWMETFKQFMAFPLYATAAWLLFVFADQVSGDNFLRGLFALTGIAFAAWLYGRYHTPSRRPIPRRLAAGVSLLLAAAAIAYGLPREPRTEWIEWSPETVAALREEGRPVYVDFTARWCVTCQVNKSVVFGSDRVLETVRDRDVALVRADWTNEDPAITRRLAELGKAAVPVTLVYLPGEEEPRLLPETLTPGIVLTAFGGETASPAEENRLAHADTP